MQSSWKIWMRSIEIYGKWSFHTHFRNAVTLVWGSLRLAPINIMTCFLIQFGVRPWLLPPDNWWRLPPLNGYCHRIGGNKATNWLLTPVGGTRSHELTIDTEDGRWLNHVMPHLGLSRKIWTLHNGPPRPCISKYLDPPELIFQHYTEISGPSLKLLVPPWN